MTFHNRKYLKLFPAACTTLAAGMLMEIIDVSVSGWLLGADAASAITVLATPITILEFESFLCGIGGTVVFLRYAGKFEELNAHKAFGTTFWLGLLVGTITAMLFFLLQEPYMGFINAGDSIGHYVREYYTPFLIVAAVQPACYSLNSLVYMDGDAKTSVCASIVQLLTNAALSFVLCRRFGISGCAFGTLAGFAASFLVLSTHLLRPAKSFRMFLHFSPRMLPPIFKFGTIDGLSLLFWSFLLLGIDAAVVRLEGPEMLVCVTVIWVITGFVTIFDAPAIAAQPLIETYLEERNYRIARSVARLATYYCVGISGIMGLAFLIFPDLVLLVADLRQAACIADARLTVRIYAVSLVFWALSFYLQRLYIFIHYTKAALFLSFLKDAILPVLMASALVPIIGVHGLWTGWCLAIPFAIVVTLAMIAKTRGRAWVPYGLPPPLPKRVMQTHSLTLKPEEIRRIKDRLASVAAQFTDEKTGGMAGRVIEASLTSILKAAGPITAHAFVTLDFSSGLAVIIGYDCPRVTVSPESPSGIPEPTLITTGAFPRLLYRISTSPASED